MSQPVSFDVFSPTDTEFLVRKGHLRPASDGTRKVSAASLTSTIDTITSIESQDSAIASDEEEMLEIPVKIESLATYEFLGFDAKTSWQFWQRFKDLTDEEKRAITFLEIATETTRAQAFKRDAFSKSDEWETTMSSWGIAEDLRKKIMDPYFEDLRLTQSALSWVLNTIRIRYEMLLRAQQISAERETQLREAQSRSGSEEWDEGIGLTLRGGGETEDEKKQRIARLPGTTRLYKGGSFNYMSDFLADKKDSKLFSREPTDFSRSTGGSIVYFAARENVAEHYAGYHKRRSGDDAAIMFVDFSNAFLESLEPVFLFLDAQGELKDAWRQIVYDSRRGDKFPTKLAQYAHSKLYIGHICKEHNETINKMSSWEKITGDNLWTWEEQYFNESDKKKETLLTRSIKATQHVFNGENALQALINEGQGWGIYKVSKGKKAKSS